MDVNEPDGLKPTRSFIHLKNGKNGTLYRMIGGDYTGAVIAFDRDSLGGEPIGFVLIDPNDSKYSGTMVTRPNSIFDNKCEVLTGPITLTFSN